MALDNRTTPDELDASGRHRLADALGDTPETVISVRLLRRGLCWAHVSGTPEDFAAAIIQPTGDPGEPIAFGEDVRAVWEILRRTTGWWCVNVPAAVAPGLAATMERELRCSVRLYDVYHTQTRTAPSIENPAARLLKTVDLPLVEAAPPEIQGSGFGSPRAMLSDGIAAGAILSGGLAAIAFTPELTERHADVGVATLEGFRGQGLATATASLLIRRIRESGLVPVWSAGEDNHASLRIARKLGFEERFRRAYVIPDRRR